MYKCLVLVIFLEMDSGNKITGEIMRTFPGSLIFDARVLSRKVVKICIPISCI